MWQNLFFPVFWPKRMRDLYIPNHPRKEVPSLPPTKWCPRDIIPMNETWLFPVLNCGLDFFAGPTYDLWTKLMMNKLVNEIMSNLCNKIEQNLVETEFFWDKTKQSWMNLCCRAYWKTNSHPSPPTTQWEVRLFFQFFLGFTKYTILPFVCEWTLDMFSMLSPKACSTKVEMCQIAKFY
jgi:hypothetical protein